MGYIDGIHVTIYIYSGTMDPLGINKWAHQLTLTGMGPHHRRYHSTMKGLNVATQDGASLETGVGNCPILDILDITL